MPSPVQAVDIRASVNGLRGPGYVKHLHFDGTYLNIMVPIVIPDITSARRGQLTIYPNIRSFAGNPKDRWVIPVLVRFRVVRGLFRSREIDYKPGDIYFFYGYRTLHGVTAPSEADRCVVGITVDM